MKRTARHAVVLVTAPDLKTARQLARLALKAHAAACANLIQHIESHYWWQGKLERASETLVLFKTSWDRIRSLEQLVVANHPYDTPEFVALPITRGNQKYLAWIERSVGLNGKPPGSPTRRKARPRQPFS